ncbi:hypothetical protein ACGF7U_12615 [Micromonospora sp. NPDC047670]|uniref:DUF6197 family protein n=1 Tax=Micromonospora sp. NPDC047670 TaxID=3364252 RepID=UPI00371B185B
MNPTQNQPDPGAPADLTPADILRCAARYLELHGWNQGTYYALTDNSPFPPACVTGAIGMAAYGRFTLMPADMTHDPGFGDYDRAVQYLVDYLDLHDENNHDDPTPFGWNDRPNRTAAQVIATLRAAADDYDWTHATEDQLETYADACVWAEKHPTHEGFLAWLGAR